MNANKATNTKAKAKKAAKIAVPTVFTNMDLAIDDLNIDAYQRDLFSVWVRDHLVTNFDNTAFGQLLVAKRADGKYWLVDGQQRREAARLLGFTHVPCMVFNSSGPKDEARIYHLVNANKKRMAPWDIWKSRLVAGDAAAAQINSTLAACGIKLVQRVTTSYQTQTVQAIVKTYENLDLQQFTNLFEILVDAFKGDRHSLTDIFIQPLGRILQNNATTISKMHMVACLKKKKPEKWRREAELVAIKLGGAGYQRYDAMESVLVRAYNRVKGIPAKLK